MIREYIPADLGVLAQVFRDSVRTIGPQFYTPQQIEIWASFADDLKEFTSRVSSGLTLVAEHAGHIVGFGQLDPDNHLALLYCCGEYSRKGIGSEIYTALEAHAYKKGVVELHTEASYVSCAFFKKHGYSITEIEQVVRFGMAFERFRMTKKKAANQALEPTTLAVMPCAPSSTSHASQGRGSSLTLGHRMREIPEFSRANWYHDPKDRRCPHDAWLESLTITEIPQGARHEIRKTEIRIRLLGAYHDGHIELTYTGVSKYVMNAEDCRKGVGDWIEDNLVALDGRLCHYIKLSAIGNKETMWLIEADDVDYAWIPKPT